MSSIKSLMRQKYKTPKSYIEVYHLVLLYKNNYYLYNVKHANININFTFKLCAKVK